MKLHRLVLTNYRGITHREIEFPDHGVVVVCGANEIGKSSMIEALDLLAGVQGPVDEEGSQAGQADPRRRRRRDHRRDQHGPLSIRLSQAVSQTRGDRADGAGASSRTAHRRRGPRTGAGDPRRDRRRGAVAGAARAAVDVDGGGGPVGMRCAVPGARRGRRRGGPAVRGRAAADRPDRRRVPALLHAHRTPDRRVGHRDQADARRRR